MAARTIERKLKAASQQASAAALEGFHCLNLELAGLAAKEEAPAASPGATAQKSAIGKRAPVYLPNGRRLGKAALWN
jgi:hypothetical protein